MKHWLISTLLLLLPLSVSAAKPSSLMLQDDALFFYIPQIVNTRYFGIELGFATNKRMTSWDIPYNAFVKAFANEESYTVNTELRAASIGFKAGLIFPTQPWLPLYIHLAGGVANTALQEDPWFGREEQTIEHKTLLLAEGGAMIRLNRWLLLSFNYQINNIDFLKRRTYMSLGINF